MIIVIIIGNIIVTKQFTYPLLVQVKHLFAWLDGWKKEKRRCLSYDCEKYSCCFRSVKKVTANDKENMEKKKKGLKARVVSYDVFAPWQ